MRSHAPKTIYAIQCTNNKRIYVGQCEDIRQRISQHFSDLSRGIKGKNINSKTRGSLNWQEDYDRYGKYAFKVFVLEKDVSYDQALDVERKYILQYKSNNPDFGYNLNVRFAQLIEISSGLPEQ